MGQLSAPNFSKEINLLFWALGQFQEVMCVCVGGGVPHVHVRTVEFIDFKTKGQTSTAVSSKKIEAPQQKIAAFFLHLRHQKY